MRNWRCWQVVRVLWLEAGWKRLWKCWQIGGDCGGWSLVDGGRIMEALEVLVDDVEGSNRVEKVLEGLSDWEEGCGDASRLQRIFNIVMAGWCRL